MIHHEHREFLDVHQAEGRSTTSIEPDRSGLAGLSGAGVMGGFGATFRFRGEDPPPPVP